MPRKIAPQGKVAPAGAAPPVAAPPKRLRLVYVPTAKLKLWEGNPRRNDAAAKELAEIIRAHGFIDPIIAARDDVVYAGNTRLKAARILGLEEVPVIYGAFRDRAQAVRYAIANNRSAEISSWDEDVLADIFGEQEGVDMSTLAAETGFAQMEIEGLRDGQALPENDPAAEWEGMPEYEHEDQTSFRRIVVHFKDQRDVDRFARLVRQSFTEKTRSIWYPKAEIGTIADKRYGE